MSLIFAAVLAFLEIIGNRNETILPEHLFTRVDETLDQTVLVSKHVFVGYHYKYTDANSSRYKSFEKHPFSFLPVEKEMERSFLTTAKSSSRRGHVWEYDSRNVEITAPWGPANVYAMRYFVIPSWRLAGIPYSNKNGKLFVGKFIDLWVGYAEVRSNLSLANLSGILKGSVRLPKRSINEPCAYCGEKPAENRNAETQSSEAYVETREPIAFLRYLDRLPLGAYVAVFTLLRVLAAGIIYGGLRYASNAPFWERRISGGLIALGGVWLFCGGIEFAILVNG